MPSFFVDRHLAPDAGVAGVAPGLVQPGVVAELVGARHRVEDPLPLAGARVEPADVPLDVLQGPRRAARQMRGADQNRVAGDDRRGVQADLAGHQVDVLVHALFQVDDAVGAEAGEPLPGRQVQPDQLISGGDIKDLSRAAVVSIGEAASGAATRRVRATLPFVEAMHPEQLAGGRIGRDDRAPQPGRRVDDATDHQRCRLEVVLGLRSEVVGLQTPGDLQITEVVGGDLGGRRVARAREVAAVGRPLEVAGVLGLDRDDPDREHDETQQPAGPCERHQVALPGSWPPARDLPGRRQPSPASYRTRGGSRVIATRGIGIRPCC